MIRRFSNIKKPIPLKMEVGFFNLFCFIKALISLTTNLFLDALSLIEREFQLIKPQSYLTSPHNLNLKKVYNNYSTNAPENHENYPNNHGCHFNPLTRITVPLFYILLFNYSAFYISHLYRMHKETIHA